MSGLDTLPPDQRAVLQLILTQGRGYADLAALLRIEVEAVRSRARAGIDALAAPADGLDASQRAQIADYLLGQQDDGARLVTFAELTSSPAACAWARRVRDRVAPLAHDELPLLPATTDAAANGRASVAAVAASAAASPPVIDPAPPAVPADTPADAPPADAPPADAAPADAAPAQAPPTMDEAPATPPAADGPPASSPPPPPPEPSADDDAGSSSSRLAGMALLAGIVALVVAIAFVVLGGDDEQSPSSSSASTQTETQTQPSTRGGQPSTRGGQSSTRGGQSSTTTTPAPQPRLVAQVNLDATASGGEAVGIGIVQRTGRQLAILIEAQRLPANGEQDIYAVWLQGDAGTRFLGFVPRQVRANGTFTVSAALPRNARRYSTVLITREGVTAVPETPGEAILTGQLRLG